MFLPVAFCVFFTCGFAMFFLANVTFLVVSIAILSVAELVLAIYTFDGIVFPLVSWVTAIGATQLGYFAALAVAARVALRKSGAGEAQRTGGAENVRSGAKIQDHVV